MRIAVVFQPGTKAKPVWFEMNNRQHRIKETTYFWKDRVGDTPLLHFAVVTVEEEALYELIFNPIDQSWTLHPQQTE